MAVEGGCDLELEKVALLKSLSTSLIPSAARNPGEGNKQLGCWVNKSEH